MAALKSHLDDEEEFDFGPTTQKGIEYRTNGPFTGRWIVIVKGHSNEQKEVEQEVPHGLKVITIDVANKGDLCTLAVGTIDNEFVKKIIKVAKKSNPALLVDGIRGQVVSKLSERGETLKFRTGNGSISTITNKYLDKSWNLYERDQAGKKIPYGNVYIYDNDDPLNIKEAGRGKIVTKTKIFKVIDKLINKPVNQRTAYDNQILLVSFGCNTFTRDVSRKERGERKFGNFDENYSKHEREMQEYNRQIYTDGEVVNALRFFAGKRTRSKKNKKKRSRRL
jgi:hypothetical protein